ncbi:MAG: adenylosuccinate lyase [Thaumarchaeota archaeon]|nr:adenylosuccinate lyase [Nitrososphaerota archaeon]|tara:strand:+ start:49 stop:1401 length:1353 start_codon:yes stop_codon:yes gene_type:complete
MPILPIDTGRYGSDEIKRIFEEQSRLDYELEFEASVAQAQGEIGLIPPKAAKEIALKARSGNISIKRVKELEAVSEHDTAAIVESINELCDNDVKPWIHYGLTSYDVVDTVISMQIRDSLQVLKPKIIKFTTLLVEKAVKYKDTPAVGRTHGQHASIIAFGLKFAVWASDMANHIERLKEMERRVLVCKTLGVVGTGSLMGIKALDVQKLVAKKLKLYPICAATQIVSRERHSELIFTVALIASTLDKIAVEIRNLQRTEINEVMEPFMKGQMGSSAVPVKKNPIKSERTSSLARLIKSMVSVSLENISLWHERDLSNSANERFTIPITVILLDEMLNSMVKVIMGLNVDENRISQNLELTRGQIYSEFVLDALIKKGMPRLQAYRTIQTIAFDATKKEIHFFVALRNDKEISSILNNDELKIIFNPNNHLAASYKIINNVVKFVRKTYK